MANKTKSIPISISLFEDEDGYWGIRDEVSGDAQTYDSEEHATADFDRIVDGQTLKEVFGW